MWTRSLFILAVSAAISSQADGAFVDDVNIPVTVEVPSGHEKDTLRLHLAAYGAIPYGEVMAGVRVVHYPDDCTCGAVRCNTGCASFNLASQSCRSPRTPLATEHSVFVLDETDADDGCTRAERAFNAAKAGAGGVILISHPNTTSLLAAVNSQDVSAAVETLQFLEHVNMPVGVMTHAEGSTLKKYVHEAEQASSVPRVRLDFRHEQQGDVVTVHVWHDTDDACGVLCHNVHAFFEDLNAIVKTFKDDSPIRVVPRFLYQTCSGPNAGTDSCKRGCVNNGKYCTLRGSRSAQAPGAMVTQESVRQACLYDALRGSAYNARQFWEYKALFQENCKSLDRNFNAKCSGDQFRKLNLAKGDVVKAAWDNCTAALNTGASSIPVADADINGQKTQKVSPYLQATVVTALAEPAASHHFRGDLDAVHVMKAACSALNATVRAAVPLCERVTQGKCRPGGPGDLACASQANAAKHTTKCVDVDTALGYDCQCDPGYMEIANVDGWRECEERNECAEFPSLCGRLVNPRNACKNVEGSFECIEDLEQQCSRENNWGGCWTGEARGNIYHSCEDLVGKVRFSLQEGGKLEDLALSQCNCEFIKGCWMGGTGECRERCPFDRCNVATGQCDNDSSLGTGGIVGVSFGVVVGAALMALVAFIVIRRRKFEHDPAKAVVSNYDNFRDGMDADEMARSGTVEMYVAGANSNGALGSGKIPSGMLVPPPNGEAIGERPPTFGAQNSFVGSLTVEEHEAPPPRPNQ